MEQFHRFISSKKHQSSNYCNENNQQNKQTLHNQDEKYLLQDSNQDQQQRQFQNQQNQQKCQEIQQNDDQIDPLDAFMQNLQSNEKQKSKSKKVQKINKKQLKKLQNKLQDVNQQNQLEFSFEQSQSDNLLNKLYNQRQNNHIDHQKQQNEQILQDNFQNDDDGSIFKASKEKKNIEVLQPYDFSQIELEDFQKDFYDEHEDINRLTDQEINAFRKQFDIKVFGSDIPRPIVSFGHLQLDDKMKNIILKEGFEKPTPIQAQTLPIALKGRDVIGVAKTGSGKTLAYVWPMITHVGHQRQSKRGQGPIGLILAPTRQLCQQIYLQTRKYSKKYDMKVSCILGGQNKHEQWKILKSGVDILIASPGRLIQMIKKKATNMFRVTYLVLDEADKMLSLGFEQQIRSIITQTRPDRQTLLFTATMKKSMQFLAFDILQSPIRINVGEQNCANQDIKQQVVIVDQKQQKLEWIKNNLSDLLKEGKVLIFCNQKDTCQQVKLFIESNLYLNALTLHGDKSQYERTTIMNSFKSNESILIATDIAGRGIDVKNIKTILNFQCPKTIEAYVHRIGRTGRAGQTGNAISFLNKSQASIKFAIQLIKIFQNSGYPVSKQLEDLACLDDFYRRKRVSSKMGVSFAKGKDASKFLNQILKKQQMGNSKAGLGMNISAAGFNNIGKQKNTFSSFIKEQNFEKQDNSQRSIAEILSEKGLSTEKLSISELSKIIKTQMSLKSKDQLSSSKLKSHFTRSTEGYLNKVNLNDNNFQIAKSEQNTKRNQITVSFYNKK